MSNVNRVLKVKEQKTMKYICKTSGLEFESDDKIIFSPQHPAIFAFQRDSGLPSAAVSRALDAVRKAGGYTTVEEYLALVAQKAPDIQREMDEAWAKQAEQKARRQAELERSDALKRKRTDDALKPGANRKERNAVLKAHGYIWKKYDVSGYGGGDDDEPEYVWMLVDPDGQEISEHQAIQEIQRGRDVVRAEIETARQKAREAAEQKAKVEAERMARYDKSLEAFDAKATEIRATCEALPREGFDWSITNDWPVIAERGLDYRARDFIKQGTINGAIHFLVVVGTGYDGDGYYNLYRQVSDTQLWASGD